MTTRERLARAAEVELDRDFEAWAARWTGPAGLYDDAPAPPAKWYSTSSERIVDAILDELMEPSEGALRGGQMEMPAEADYWMENRILHCEPRALHKCVPPKNVWQAILTHIKEDT